MFTGGPLAPGDGDRTTLQVGDRAPDSEVRGPDGAAACLFDTYRGPHFTLVAFGRAAAAASDRLDWPATGAPLRRVSVIDPQPDLRRNYGFEGDTVVLVRPDGYIGHIASRDLLPSIRSAVRAVTPVAQQDTAV